ncbi:MAG TPA: transglutaminase domain-containing protein [Anaerolineales bacterium]|nr:transglutaminase domain-containing protein [Anaerolineales bacterium]
MTELMIRLGRKLFTAEVMGLILIAASLQLFTQGITVSLSNTNTRYFFLVCIVAAMISLGLGKKHWKPYQAAVGMAALGAAGVWIIGARLVMPLIDLIRSLISVLPEIVPALQEETPIDTSHIRDAWSVIVQASLALALRFQGWFKGLDENAGLNDGLIRNMIWLLLLWLIAAWMGWFAARRKAAQALIPAVLLLAFVTSYSERRIEMLWGLVFLMLLLMGIWNYKNHTHQWETRRVDYSESIQSDITQAVVLLVTLVSLLAFITPSISWRAIRDYFRVRSENQVADALGVQEQRFTLKAINVPVPKPVLPRDHLLGGGFANSEKLVMTVRTGELPPVVIQSLTLTVDAPRYYWRSLVYDEYAGGGWVTSSAVPQKYDADTPLIPGLLSGYKPLHLEVQLLQPEAKIFWSGTLFSADIPLTVNWRLKPSWNLFADRSDLLRADMFAAAPDEATSAVRYTAEAYIPDVTIAELRAASTEYPPEIYDRYLKLPNELPQRVRDLAWLITKDKINPYDKAKAIETYLRTEYPYDLEVPAPPAGRDVVDYFLFDLNRGYCDYYATAMVVLARARGIPARFVSGYSPGTYDLPNAQYLVREMNAHSWVEVYFPEIGWVEFEPTGSIPEILRKEKDETDSPAADNDTAASRLLTRFRLEQLSYVLFPLAIFLFAFLLYFALIEPWWYMRLSPSIAIERIYRKFHHASRPLMGKRIGSETALEFAARMIDKLDERFSNSRLKRLYANTQDEIDHLTDLYYTVLFRNIRIHEKDSRTAWDAWRHIRWRLWIARMNSPRSLRRKSWRLLLKDSQ